MFVNFFIKVIFFYGNQFVKEIFINFSSLNIFPFITDFIICQQEIVLIFWVDTKQSAPSVDTGRLLITTVSKVKVALFNVGSSINL